jgi:PAS domain S-box-containing protein
MLAAAHALHSLAGELALPLFDGSAIFGCIVVGAKRSGDPYFAEDIDFLETFTGQASVAITNAKLYHEVVLVNDYLDNILSTMDSGVIAVTAAGTVSLFNSAAERLTGLRLESQRAMSLDHLPPALSSPLRQTLQTKSSRSQFETTIGTPDGAAIPLVCSTATLRDRHGSTHGALVVFSDLSRLKHLEGEKRRAERLASFGALASGVAHEIKNPLVAIRTFAELLPERFTDVDFRDDFSKVVTREIARIDDLVGRLRGIAATPPPQIGAIDIREPIKDTLVLLRARFEQSSITVHLMCDDASPLVAVHEAQLKQLFLNIFLNAVEAMGTAGTLSVRVSRRELQGATWVVVDVSDSGSGIPESFRARIFDPFFTTKPTGSGLGLAICRGITDAHRGTIRATQNPDTSGTTISVELPGAAAPDHLPEPMVAHN